MGSLPSYSDPISFSIAQAADILPVGGFLLAGYRSKLGGMKPHEHAYKKYAKVFAKANCSKNVTVTSA